MRQWATENGLTPELRTLGKIVAIIRKNHLNEQVSSIGIGTVESNGKSQTGIYIRAVTPEAQLRLADLIKGSTGEIPIAFETPEIVDLTKQNLMGPVPSSRFQKGERLLSQNKKNPIAVSNASFCP